MPDSKKPTRSPIVVVLGHVDHGKSSLLQYIRKTEMLKKEAGGITQATGAYEVLYHDKRITFIDTPGHEAFGKMRSRGANVADIAILVVAADDGVKPQTKESIQILKQAKLPFIVAINKIDKNNADPERVKKDLAQYEVQLEGYGGDISFELISAKTGEGVEKLLDLILFAVEFQDLTYNPSVRARGVIIEAKRDKFRGNVVTAIVKDGTLRNGDEIFTSTTRGKVKSLQNFLRENETELQPSSPALILGFEELPEIGEEFTTDAEAILSAKSEAGASVPKPKKAGEDEELIIILKADTAGSLEAASQIIGALSEDEVVVRIWNSGVGNITDSDVKDASAAHATIIGFNTSADKAVEVLAQNQNVKIITSNIVYDLVDKAKAELQRIKIPPPIGILEVLKIFSQKNSTQLIGGRVLEGEFRNKSYLDISRGDPSAGSRQDHVLGHGRVKSLKSGKQDASRVEAGKECGVLVDSPVVIEVGDKIVIPPPMK